MKKLFFWLAILTLLLCFFVKQGLATDTELKPYVHDTEKFQISLPVGWVAQTNQMGTSVIAFSESAGPADIFSENVNVVTENLPIVITARQYFERNLVSMQKVLPNFQLLKTQDVVVNGLPAVKIISTYIIGNHQVKAEALFVVKDTRCYVITATALMATFEDFFSVFDRVLDTTILF